MEKKAISAPENRADNTRQIRIARNSIRVLWAGQRQGGRGEKFKDPAPFGEED